MSQDLLSTVEGWLESCRRHGSISRNTVAVGIVILDALRRGCPLRREEVLSRGGEITGARSGLGKVLERYGIPRTYLREATTRQVHQDGQRLLDALGYGDALAGMGPQERDQALLGGIQRLKNLADEWLARQHLVINCDRQLSPSAWVGSILEEAGDRSGGKVEQHLVGAKLEKRFPDTHIPNLPTHAGDVQTGRLGDFTVGSTAYHVTAHPTLGVIEKCADNVRSGLHPMLLVPRAEVTRAAHFADAGGVSNRVTIVAIEDFLTLNVIELSEGRQDEFINVLKDIIARYNRRLAEVETDMSLKIDIR